MNQNFSDRLGELLDNKQANFDSSAGSDSSRYAGEGNGRYLCFVWTDKAMQFLNYSYLVSCRYTPEENIIILWFTTHVVNIKGLRLRSLFNDLMQQLPRIITCTDNRYNSLENGEALVNEIEITEL